MQSIISQVAVLELEVSKGMDWRILFYNKVKFETVCDGTVQYHIESMLS